MATLAAADAPPDAAPATRTQLMPLLRELGHLKRIHSAGRSGSIATRLFLRAWSALLAGAPVGTVMQRTVAAALAAARLGDLDADKLEELGLAPGEARQVLERGFDAVSGAVDQRLARLLRAGLGEILPDGEYPRFARQLAEQPRAGVTCPGKPRLVLQPAENHAEHSIIVALYGVMLSASFGADPARVFLAGLAHHLHNAPMPDSGFTGEMLLGRHLDTVIARARLLGLDQLSPALRSAVAETIAFIADDATAEGRAFHAADAIDRVLEIEQHLTAARLTMDVVLHDYELVHDGPVKGFHDRILREVELL